MSTRILSADDAGHPYAHGYGYGAYVPYGSDDHHDAGSLRAMVKPVQTRVYVDGY